MENGINNLQIYIKIMQTIALPKKIEFEPDKDKNSGNIIIQPCFPGYGITLGNSLRRVLLSSLPGAAIVGVKIEGVEHEFTTLPHLKEDILEFILNFKKLRLKVFSDEIVKLKLEIHGKKKITAGDIEKNTAVEIMNPELVLGNITDMAGNLSAEIYASQGMGYEMVENREKKEKLIGFIDIDSIFSPVISAGIKIENVRVGKMTNWDKLIISIKTDGTISPKEAFDKAVRILIGQYQALMPDGAEDKEKEEEKKDSGEKGEAKPKKRGRPKKTDK